MNICRNCGKESVTGHECVIETTGNKSASVEVYLCEDDIYALVDDVEELREYLNGWDDAIKADGGKTFYKKKYVDMFVNR
jgi:hypothetical protein